LISINFLKINKKQKNTLKMDRFQPPEKSLVASIFKDLAERREEYSLSGPCCGHHAFKRVMLMVATVVLWWC